MKRGSLRNWFFGAWLFCEVQAAAADQPGAFNIQDFGAVNDGSTLNTTAIQAAINQAAAAGGTVVIPEGVFMSGALFLKDGANLHLEKNAVLKGSSEVKDYPKRPTRIEGHTEPWLPALVNASGANGLRITGEGVMDGNGQPFWEEFWRRRKENGRVTNLEVERPRLLFIEKSQDVQVRGITLRNSGFWNFHLYRCKNVRIENVRIEAIGGKGPSTDGIDIDSSQQVTVRGCTIDVNDDCIALKGTKGPFALDDKESPPVEGIRIIGCTFKGGHGAVTFGSEATIVRDVLVEDCVVDGNMPVFRMKLRPDTPQTYENITCRNLSGKGGGALISVAPWTQFFSLKGEAPPSSAVKGVRFIGVKGAFGFGSIKGHARASISDVSFEGVALTMPSQFSGEKVENVRFNNVTINGIPHEPNASPPPKP